ncbi:MAG: rhomboid family intramembrane serine protease [Candidatus Binatia bacterium]
MYTDRGPRWLGKLERRLRWLSIPNMAGLLVGLQLVGFALVYSDPEWLWRLALVPDLVLQGEWWRLVSFLALPISLSPFWVLFVLWFLYFIVEGIENLWGSFRTTFYVLISVILTICFSLLFGVTITSVGDLESTLFLAAAALSPDTEILLFFVLPVKLLWLAWLTGAFILWRLVTGSWLERLYILLIYLNYLLFFGPYHYGQLKQRYRRWAFKRQMR